MVEKLKNEEIISNDVLLIDENGVKVGIMPTKKALDMAYDRNLDLVQLTDLDTPVCRIIDYSKFLYDEKKKKKNSNNHNITKELQFRPNTFINDLHRLIKQAQKFIDDGLSVKFTVQFKGREVSFAYKAIESFNHIEQTIILPKGYGIKKDDSVNNNKMVLFISKSINN